MKYTLSLLVLAFFLISGNTAFSQAQRTLGGSRLDLDDNAGNHVFLSNASGSLGVNVLGTAPNTCALLDLVSTSKGLLIPRMNAVQELALCSGTPPEGLMVYNTTSHSVDVYNGTIWGSSSGWGLFGNSGTNPAVNFLGTTDANDLVLRTNSTERMRILSGGNIGIGTPTPTDPLELVHTFAPSVAGSNLINFRNLMTYSPTAVIGVSNFGLYSQLSAKTSTATLAALIGMAGEASVEATSSANIANLIASSGIAINFSAASSVNNASGVSGQVLAQAGSITNANAVQGTIFTGTGSITNAADFHALNASTGSGAITNFIGVDIDQLTSGANNTAFRYNHPTQPVLISGAGDVRIGGTPSIFTPPGLITTRTATTPVGGAKLATESQLIVSPAAVGGTQYIATYSHLDAANALSLASSSLYGVWGGAELINATAPIGSARGVFGELFYQTTQPLNDGAGLAGIIDMEAAGSIGTASGVRVSFVKNAGGTITDLKLLNVLDLFSNVGTITNTYGLYIGDITIGTQTNQAYSLYASDANTRSFIAGNTGIGTTFTSVATDPLTAVDIAGALSVRYNNSTFILSAIPAFNNSAFLNMGSGSSQQGFVTFVPSAPGSNISGIGPGTNGRILIIHKGAGGTLVFINEDAANEPTADNRIHCVSGANATIPAGEAIITLIHEGNPGGGINRWLILSVNTAF